MQMRPWHYWNRDLKKFSGSERDSNPRSLRCRCSALPTELSKPHESGSMRVSPFHVDVVLWPKYSKEWKLVVKVSCLFSLALAFFTCLMFHGAFETASTSIIPPASSNTLLYMVKGPMGRFTLSSIDCLVLEAVVFLRTCMLFLSFILVLHQGKVKLLAISLRYHCCDS